MASEVRFRLEGVFYGWPPDRGMRYRGTFSFTNTPVLYRIRILVSATAESNEGQRIRYLTAPQHPQRAAETNHDPFLGLPLAFDTDSCWTLESRALSSLWSWGQVRALLN
ncbi:hypothetical protein RRF57_003692 [Xylaria bambusicola]|uniref:Uncharacterized protein n=1 Tax=Xylaria bambusicola TaxID=326684 RepID=A0AAN7Z324_9PEZI